MRFIAVQRFYNKLVITLFFVGALFSTRVSLAAQHGGGSTSSGGSGSTSSGGSSSGSDLQNPLAFGSLDEFLKALLDIVVQIGFPLVVLAVIYTGFLFVKAQGKPEELDTAKRAFFWVVIGALIILGAAALSALIQGTVNEII